METKYTPGPWVTNKTHIYANGKPIACAWPPRSMPDANDERLPGESWADAYVRLGPERSSISNEQLSNARLIAAAPEMAELLRELRDYVSCIPESAAGGDDVAIALTRKADALLARIDGGAE